MIRFLVRFVAFLMTVYAGLCIAMYLVQDSLIYYPVLTPHQNDSNVEIFRLNGENIVVVCYRPNDQSNETDALVYFGGNAEDVSASMWQLAKAFPQKSIYAMHYRGYGGSTGQPRQSELFADALALFDKIQTKHKQIVVMGRSLGTGVATFLVSQRSAQKLILVTPYFSLEQVARDQYPFLPAKLLLRDKYESYLYAPKVNAPVLMVVAERDQLTPIQGSIELQNRFRPGQVKRVMIKQAWHNGISNHPEYLEVLRDF